MKNVFLGLLLVAAMSISLGVNAQDTKTKKDAPKAETTKTETTKSEATCCSATTKVATCCSMQGADAKSDEKKDCCQIEKKISDKKTEAKKKK